MLIVAAEDYTGASPVQATGPNYLGYYEDALEANGTGYDVYDVDDRGRLASDALGVLSHYDAVIWYTGEDVVTREPGWGPGNQSRLAMDQILEVRDFLNEGGQVLYTGKYAASQFTPNIPGQFYDPTEANAQCQADPAVLIRCRAPGGSGDFTNDVLQYWLGAYLAVDNAGTTDDGLLDVLGIDTPFTGLEWGFNGADSAENQNHSNSFITTSGILDPALYPQFESWVSAKWDRVGGPFEPHTGDYYAYSQIADVSYKRLTRTIAVPAGGATMSFWTSFDTEAEWDHLAVEARTAGGDDWTTLPDVNGNTSQETGESCPAGWNELHPQLDFYQTVIDETSCDPTGTSGEWNAASGNSGGWQQWSVDLSAYAGGSVEVSIAYISDWATQGLGVFVDDIEVSTGEGTTSFEAGDDWRMGGHRGASGQRAEPERLHHHDGGGIPRGCRGGDAALAPLRLRVRGHLRCRDPSRLDGPGAGPPARLRRVSGCRVAGLPATRHPSAAASCACAAARLTRTIRERARIQLLEQAERHRAERRLQVAFEPLASAVGRALRPHGRETRRIRDDRVDDELPPERRVLALRPRAAATTVVRDREVAQQRRGDESVEERLLPAQARLGAAAHDD